MWVGNNNRPNDVDGDNHNDNNDDDDDDDNTPYYNCRYTATLTVTVNTKEPASARRRITTLRCYAERSYATVMSSVRLSV